MSRENVMKLYRYFNKSIVNHKVNSLYKDFLKKEIENFSRRNANSVNQELALQHVNVKIENYLKMNQHSNSEREILESYGIGTNKNQREKIENVAKYVGLRVKF
jgi:hypothetical protein